MHRECGVQTQRVSCMLSVRGTVDMRAWLRGRLPVAVHNMIKTAAAVTWAQPASSNLRLAPTRCSSGVETSALTSTCPGIRLSAGKNAKEFWRRKRCGREMARECAIGGSGLDWRPNFFHRFHPVRIFVRFCLAGILALSLQFHRGRDHVGGGGGWSGGEGREGMKDVAGRERGGGWGVDARFATTQLSQRIIQTQQGKVRGLLVLLPPAPFHPPHFPRLHSSSSSTGAQVQVEAYIGIEYASLLGGDLRFMAPTTPVTRWTDVRYAHKFKPVCPQRIPDLSSLEKTVLASKLDYLRRLVPFIEIQQEDCLNLNVYTPVTDNNQSSKLPVVVFVHGESHETGTGNAYDGSALAGYGHVIVVTINYRLGVLGFLSTEDSNARGNYGLLDIVAALHWVSDNIAGFGGDPHEVTLLGHGYGGALVNLLLVAPVTRGRRLFKRAIIHSGTALSSWAISQEPLFHALQLADRLNCSHVWDPTQPLPFVQCLKHFSAEELVNVVIDTPKYLATFGPTVDAGGGVLPAPIRSVLPAREGDASGSNHGCKEGGEFANTPLLIGVRDDEGCGYLTSQDVLDGVSDERLARMLRTFVQNTFTYHQQKIYDILLHNYNGWDRPRDRHRLRDDVAQLLGDALVAAPCVDLAQRHARCASSASAGTRASTYLYSFGRPPRTGGFWEGGVAGEKVRGLGPAGDFDGDETEGCRGGFNDDLGFIFAAPLSVWIDPFRLNYTDEEKRLDLTMLVYWTNFIKTSNPNEAETSSSSSSLSSSSSSSVSSNHRRFSTSSTTHKSQPTWPEYDPVRQQYMSLGATSKPDHHYRSKKISLWLDLLPQIHRKDAFDPIYHLLDDFTNTSSFDEVGTKPLNLDQLRAAQFKTVTSSTTAPSTSTRFPARSNASIKSKRTTKVTATLPYSSTPSKTLLPITYQSALSRDEGEIEEDGEEEEEEDGSIGQRGDVTALSSTLSVGLTLLLLNIIVFAAAFCQWTRLRRSKRQSADKRREAGSQHPVSGNSTDDGSYVGTRLRHTDADCSTAFENSYSTRALMGEKAAGVNDHGGRKPGGGGDGTGGNNSSKACHHYNNRKGTSLSRHDRHEEDEDDEDDDECHESLPLRTFAWAGGAGVPGVRSSPVPPPLPANNYAKLASDATDARGSPRRSPASSIGSVVAAAATAVIRRDSALRGVMTSPSQEGGGRERDERLVRRSTSIDSEIGDDYYDMCNNTNHTNSRSSTVV